MASEPVRIVWSETAVAEFKTLTFEARIEILRRIDLLRIHPLIYQVEQVGRWAGLRRFHAGPKIVFYTYWQQDHSVYVEAIVPARADKGSV